MCGWSTSTSAHVGQWHSYNICPTLWVSGVGVSSHGCMMMPAWFSPFVSALLCSLICLDIRIQGTKTGSTCACLCGMGFSEGFGSG